MARKGKEGGGKSDVEEEDRVSAVNYYMVFDFVHDNMVVEHDLIS